MPRISQHLDIHHQVESPRGAQVNSKYLSLVDEVVKETKPYDDETEKKLLERPHEALVADFVYLQDLYAKRVIDVPRSDGVRERQFATRTFNEATGVYQLDDRYRVVETPDGNTIYSISTRLAPDAGGTEIVFDSEGIISARTLVPGYTIPMPREHYAHASSQVLERTLATAKIANEREANDPVMADSAHENARDLLEIELGL